MHHLVSRTGRGCVLVNPELIYFGSGLEDGAVVVFTETTLLEEDDLSISKARNAKDVIFAGKGLITALSRRDLQGILYFGKFLEPNADLRKMNLTGFDLAALDLWGVNLSHANLEEASLADSKLNRANLEGANLEFSTAPSASFREANLQGANLQHSDCSEADFRDADLRGAKLQGATLEDALLEGADLRGAYVDEDTSFGNDTEWRNYHPLDLKDFWEVRGAIYVE